MSEVSVRQGTCERVFVRSETKKERKLGRARLDGEVVVGGECRSVAIDGRDARRMLSCGREKGEGEIDG